VGWISSLQYNSRFTLINRGALFDATLCCREVELYPDGEFHDNRMIK